MKKASIIFLILVGIQICAFGAESAHGGAHGEDAIPTKTIMYQAINLGILLIVLFFAVRKTVVALFKARYVDYSSQAAKTEAANRQAQEALSDIKNRINQLQTSEQTAILNAQSDALALKNKMIQETQSQAEKLKADTKLIVAAELNNAKNEIRKEIINASIEIAKGQIKNSAADITKKSEQSFLSDLAKTKQVIL
ncbi:MAG: ATP synthase F0 subunit B [Moraxellaceae bacterium]|nr:ATP synthase F0 subunit B [Pseudobdellovibrionaceae bacterium]